MSVQQRSSRSVAVRVSSRAFSIGVLWAGLLCCGPAYAQACTADLTPVNVAAQPIVAAGRDGRLADVLSVLDAINSGYARLCGGPTFASLNERGWIARYLLELGHWREADQLAAELVPVVEARTDGDDLTERLLLIRIEAAVPAQDAARLAARVSDYTGWLSRTKRYPFDPPTLAYFRRCLREGFIRRQCETGDTILYGQFAARRLDAGAGDFQSQFKQSAPVRPAAFAPGSPGSYAAKAFQAFNEARQLERDLAPLAARWMLAVSRHDSKAAAAAAPALRGQLAALALAVRSFDPTALSHVQPRILDLFVQATMLRLLAAEQGTVDLKDSVLAAMVADLIADAEKLRGDATAAFVEHQRGGRGFLRADSAALLAFQAMADVRNAPMDRAERVWQLLASSFGDGTKPGALADIRRGLAADEQMIGLFTAVDSTGVVLSVSRDEDPRLDELDPGGPSLVALSRTIAEAGRSAPAKDTDFPIGASQALYAALICPAEAQWKSQTQPRRLTFYLDAFAERLPLTLLARPDGACRGRLDEAAIVRTASVTSLADTNWLGLTKELKIVPLGATLPARPSPISGYLGVAVPDAGGSGGVSGPIARAALARLRNANAEIRESAALFPARNATLLFAEQARERPVRKALAHASGRLVHFATHAIDPGRGGSAPAEPAIVLAAGRDGNDGLLLPQEISTLTMPGSTVMLSMCNSAEPATGLGKGLVSGLGGAFLNAGSQAAIITYWSVDDAASAQLAPVIARGIAAGQEAPTAIREAQIAYRATTKNALYKAPFFWASYIAIAPPGEVER